MSKEYIEYLKSTGRYDDFVSNMYGLGWTASDIAKELETSRQNIHNALNRHTAVLEAEAERILYLSEAKQSDDEQ